MLNLDYNTKGWDWEELAVVLGLAETEDEFFQRYPDDQEDLPAEMLFAGEQARAEVLRRELNSWAFCGWEKGGKTLEDQHKVAIAVRNFVKQVIRGDHGLTPPLWKGLLKIKDDSEFLRYVAVLLEYLWT